MSNIVRFPGVYYLDDKLIETCALHTPDTEGNTFAVDLVDRKGGELLRQIARFQRIDDLLQCLDFWSNQGFEIRDIGIFPF